jgi:hypothetical protein
MSYGFRGLTGAGESILEQEDMQHLTNVFWETLDMLKKGTAVKHADGEQQGIKCHAKWQAQPQRCVACNVVTISATIHHDSEANRGAFIQQ